MEKIRIACVGLGRLGKKHAENLAYRVRNAELSAVCSSVEEEVNLVKKEFDIKAGYLDMQEMLEKEKLDAVWIASSNKIHAEHIKMALEAGLHVFSEKPFGIDMEQAEATYKVVKKHQNKVFMLGYQRRFDPSYAYAKELINKGKIGRPFLIRCTDLDPITMIRGVIGGSDRKGISAIEYAKTSGGLFLDMSSHAFDLARWYMESEVESLYAMGSNFVVDEYNEVGDFDTGVVSMKFKNGNMALFYSGRTCVHGYQIETEIVGTDGILRVGTIPEKNLVTIFDESGAVRECSNYFLERFEKAFEIEAQEFVNCIIEGRRGFINEEDGYNATKIAYSCKESIRTNSIIKVN